MTEPTVTQNSVFPPTLMESKTSRLDDILQEKLEKAFHKQTSKVRLHDIAKIACEHSPIDLAYAAFHLPQQARIALYENLPHRDAKMKFVINTDNETRVTLFRQIREKEMKKLFEKMPTDEAVSVLEDMSERRFRRLMELLDSKKSSRIIELREHDRKSAGRLMTSEFFAFNMDMTIGEASDYIRDNPHVDFTRGIFILNHAKELQGYVPARNMIINPLQLPLRQVMRPVLHKVSPESSREEVVDLVERYKISSLPVVDMDDYLVGVITYEDVVEAMEDLADETIARMAGTGERMDSQEPIFKRFLARSPWLVVTLFAGLVNVGVMSSFQKHVGGVLTFVLFFVPLITGMSGNIGIQCSTILVRSMAIGALSSGMKKDAIKRELLTGLFIGSFFGAACGSIVYSLDALFDSAGTVSSVAISVIIGSGLIGACTTGTLLGVFSTLFFQKIGVDPAISSGPIVTAFNDFLSMLIYFIIAWGLKSLFF